ncbi:hypothetical protein H70357_04760 [Paenibacillus sp. FSL H7-0357]|uniref:hypothetical protein n=1 Tax=Paenibacillus sp. FSL H7-0357 TaxID=1536774 RepID=UPI0004F91A7B|nr:hypothetical protein H70357_04760 [Paenibacillus sp. FSL H7-0357]
MRVTYSIPEICIVRSGECWNPACSPPAERRKSWKPRGSRSIKCIATFELAILRGSRSIKGITTFELAILRGNRSIKGIATFESVLTARTDLRVTDIRPGCSD